MVAKPLVLLTLTAKWSRCIPYLQLLCIAGAFYPVQVINLSALTAQGRSDLFLGLEVAKKCILVAAVAISWRFGITAMIYSQILVMLISCYLNSFYTGRHLSYGFFAQMRDMAPYAGASLVMGGVLYLLGSMGWSSNLLLLTTQICSGAAVYLGTCRLCALAAFMDLWWRWPLLAGIRTEGIMTDASPAGPS
jgi:O-antigen/teichoic acid export membrane protein